jgi:hypothetical protein
MLNPIGQGDIDMPNESMTQPAQQITGSKRNQNAAQHQTDNSHESYLQSRKFGVPGMWVSRKIPAPRPKHTPSKDRRPSASF